MAAKPVKDAAHGTPQNKQAESTSSKGSKDQGAIASLKQDHRQVEKIFKALEAETDDQRKTELINEVCAALILHTQLEEEIFYPACRHIPEAEPALNEAQVEHDGAKLLIEDLIEGDASDPYRDAKVSVLKEQIQQHVAEEEQPKTGVFALATAHEVDSAELAERLAERRQVLQRRAARLRPTRAISLNIHRLKEDDMARYSSNDRDRDEYGRFTSDDDDRGYRRSASRGGSSRYDDDDHRGRRPGWYGDSEGHSRAARSRYEDDDDRRYRGRYDEDDGRGRGHGGWYGDSEGHSRAARGRNDDDDRRYRSRYEDDDRGGRGRGHGGWFGDADEHSEASRRGWDNPRHGPSGWYGDSEGHSEASRRGWDNPRHRPSGWYGDSEGHAEASRRGWDRRR